MIVIFNLILKHLSTSHIFFFFLISENADKQSINILKYSLQYRDGCYICFNLLLKIQASRVIPYLHITTVRALRPSQEATCTGDRPSKTSPADTYLLICSLSMTFKNVIIYRNYFKRYLMDGKFFFLQIKKVSEKNAVNHN